MADGPASASDGEETTTREKSWNRITRKRRLRAQLDREIAEETPAAVDDAAAHGVGVPELAKAWGVTQAWIYKVAPRRPKKDQ